MAYNRSFPKEKKNSLTPRSPSPLEALPNASSGGNPNAAAFGSSPWAPLHLQMAPPEKGRGA